MVFPLRCLGAVAVAGLAFVLTPAVPAIADEDPGVRAPRMRTAAPRVRTVYRTRTVQRVRTVERFRTRAICYDYAGQPFDCRMPAPVMPQPVPQPVYHSCGGCAPAPVVQYVQPVVQYVAPPPQYYIPATTCGGCAPAVAPPAPRYYSSCGGCGPQYLPMPYTWHRHHRHAWR